MFDLLAGITLGVHLMSVHIPAVSDQQNFNYGVYATTEDGWTAGAYRNTLGKASVYAGKQFNIYGPLDITVGAISGYPTKYPVMLAPSVRLGPARIWVVPRVSVMQSNVIHLSLEKTF